MPNIPSLNLTHQSPVYSYTSSVMTSASVVNAVSGNILTDGLGNQLSQLLFITTSYSQTCSVFANVNSFTLNATNSIFSTSASWASKSLSSTSASFASRSVSSSYSFSSSITSYSILCGQATAAFSSNTSTSASWASNSLSSSFVIGYILPAVSSGSLSASIKALGNNNNYYLSMVSGSTGQQPFFVDTGLTYNPFTNILTTQFLSASSATASLLGTASCAKTASYSMTASKAFTASYIYPSAGTVNNPGPLTGSATLGGYGFLSATEFITFMQSITSSMQQFASLLTKLRSQGLIS